MGFTNIDRDEGHFVRKPPEDRLDPGVLRTERTAGEVAEGQHNRLLPQQVGQTNRVPSIVRLEIKVGGGVPHVRAFLQRTDLSRDQPAHQDVPRRLIAGGKPTRSPRPGQQRVDQVIGSDGILPLRHSAEETVPFPFRDEPIGIGIHSAKEPRHHVGPLHPRTAVRPVEVFGSHHPILVPVDAGKPVGQTPEVIGGQGFPLLGLMLGQQPVEAVLRLGGTKPTLARQHLCAARNVDQHADRLRSLSQLALVLLFQFDNRLAKGLLHRLQRLPVFLGFLPRLGLALGRGG